MKQYVPLKPTKRGFKVWVRADSVTGYFCDFNAYVGRETSGTEVGLGERVVSQLCKDIEGHNYHIYCDNFFSSVSLFESLLEHHVYACGTVRRDRKGFPIGLKHIQLSQRGEYQAMQRNELVATVWRDKKDVVTLSTQSNPTKEHQVLRRQKDGTRVSVSCPEAIHMYNRYMGGVDKGDQLRKYYHVRLKCQKNYKYIFWFAFDTAITNASILSQYSVTTVSQTHLLLKNFRLRLAERLIGNYCSRRRAGRPHSSSVPSHPPPLLPTGRLAPHLPSHQTGLRKQCVYCSQYRVPRQRRMTVWFCAACDGHPPLCLTGRGGESDCYRLWHQNI